MEVLWSNSDAVLYPTRNIAFRSHIVTRYTTGTLRRQQPFFPRLRGNSQRYPTMLWTSPTMSCKIISTCLSNDLGSLNLLTFVDCWEHIVIVLHGLPAFPALIRIGLSIFSGWAIVLPIFTLPRPGYSFPNSFTPAERQMSNVNLSLPLTPATKKGEF